MAYTGNLIPTMTSITAPYGIASASTENTSTTHPAWMAMDKSNSTYWSTTTGGVTPCNLNYLFILPQIIDSYSITASTTTNTAPHDWKFQGRNAGTWTDLDTQAHISFTSNEKKTYTFVNTTAYQEYRILVSANNGGTTTQIAEIEMMATIAGNIKVVNERLQIELTQSNIKVVNERLQIELTQSNTKVAGYALQVEFLEPVAATSRYKLFDGSTWVVYPLKRYNGAWNDVSNLTKWYNGSWQT